MLSDIHTWTSADEVAELQRLAATRRVLELGTWRGHTAIAMSKTALVVMTVDTHLGDQGTIESMGPQFTLPIFIDNMKNESGSKGRIIPVIGENSDILRLLYWLNVTFDMIFIDAAHDYKNVKYDTESSFLLLRPNGYISWHDFWTSSVNQAANELIESQGLIEVSTIDRLGTYQRR